MKAIITSTTPQGFSLIEVMVAMTIFSILISAIMAAFHDQMKLNNTQQQVLRMQQNARTAMHFMARELRMAGYDPTGSAGAGIHPDPDKHDRIAFSMDITGGEADGVDNDHDGVHDNLQEATFGDGALDDANEVVAYTLKEGRLKRATANGPAQTMADNIDVLDFEYFGVNPKDASCQNDCHLELTRASAHPDDIRFVQVSIITRSGLPEGADRYHVHDSSIYCNQQDRIILDKQKTPDNLHRMLLTTEIRLRNLGLQ